MSPEAQRIAIAEACDITEIRKLGYRLVGYRLKPWENGLARVELSVPDYLGDLNAMHEAEKVLGPAGHERMCTHLLVATNATMPFPDLRWSTVRSMVSATAAQRAEAFLRTLGLWDDTK